MRERERGRERERCPAWKLKEDVFVWQQSAAVYLELMSVFCFDGIQDQVKLQMGLLIR
jgi:hypothetical protein